MTRPESDGIYAQACLSRRIVPQKEEGSQWYKALAMFETRDVEAALDGWWRSSDRDSSGELKSKWLPAPGELVPLVVSANRARLVNASAPQEYVGWECETCRYRCGGFLPEGGTRSPTCPRCSTSMNEIHRRRAA